MTSTGSDRLPPRCTIRTFRNHTLATTRGPGGAPAATVRRPSSTGGTYAPNQPSDEPPNTPARPRVRAAAQRLALLS